MLRNVVMMSSDIPAFLRLFKNFQTRHLYLEMG
jgi:hypothetical protein